MISDWIVFIKVIECKSFSIAARDLHKSVSTISKSVAKLEEHLNCKLISRNAHKFEVTLDGNITYEKAKLLSIHYNELMTALSSPENIIQGTLRLSAPSILCDTIIISWIIEYVDKNKESKINLISREAGGFSANSPEFDDLVIKSGHIDSPDLIHKKINPVPFGIYASPGYISTCDEIISPADISKLRILKLQHPSLSGPIKFKRGSESEIVKYFNEIAFTSNSVNSLINLAVEGKGVCLAVPDWTVTQYLKDGRLQKVLPSWQLPSLPSYLVWRYRNTYSNLFRDFISFIENKWNDFFNV